MQKETHVRLTRRRRRPAEQHHLHISLHHFVRKDHWTVPRMADGAGMESFSSSSSSASTSMRPTFDQLNAELFSRGFVPSPLDVTGMRSSSVNQLADALHAMLSQRQQDVEFREAVSAKNRSLASSLERTQRFLAEEKEKRLDAERGLEASKAKVR